MLKVATPEVLGDIRSPLQKLQESEFEFALTGSRRFGTHNEMSDFDFYVKKSSSVAAWLEDNGFALLENDAAYDIPGIQVYRSGRIDVQLRNDVEQFEKLNQWFDHRRSAYATLQGYEPSDRKVIWHFLGNVL